MFPCLHLQRTIVKRNEERASIVKTFIRFNLSPFVVENKQRKREHVYIKDEMKGMTVGLEM
jgi:hypothetical protein